MNEQSKAAVRRHSDGAFLNRYFVGRGIDIGGGPDPLGQYVGVFPLMQEVMTWDREQGDAQYLEALPDNCVDFIHSSHCLEHMVDVRVALDNWIRVVKPGGFLIITVPDEDYYELGDWPSQRNSDHKWSFTIYKPQSTMPKSINVLDLLREVGDRVGVERVCLQNNFFRKVLAQANFDQTLTPVAECAIEFVLQKRPTFSDELPALKASAPEIQILNQ
ncbi:methyltransferase domain-containing protein [Parachitinimonas caeni]|uniref:Methyltransferase domain-containing protein n=1 Tax=Parachitinimonas caeni TaxID=3031301 RepID=A0ABT7DYB4_9NEIS|nr:class I SAM-dependent methyltransferase [Parachitinimonas caeni]MDK2125055.1 methyltransferase domain-containing protein [Parachitinimonas caeni]